MTNELNVWAPLSQYMSGEISYDEVVKRLTGNLDEVVNSCIEASSNNETILFENGNRIIVLPVGENHRCESHKIVTPIVNDDGTVDYCWDEEFLRDILSPFEATKDTFDTRGENSD